MRESRWKSLVKKNLFIYLGDLFIYLTNQMNGF